MERVTRIPIPKSRRFVWDAGADGLKRPTIQGLFEVDVTDARAILDRGSDDDAVSLTAFLVWCLGRAAQRHPRVHAYRHRRDLVVFDEVDATLMVETNDGGFSFPRAHVMRDLGRRDLLEVHQEIRSIRAATGDDTARLVRRAGLFLRLPATVRRIAYRAFLRDPLRRKRLMGTLAVTSVGMHADRGFWGIALPQHTLQVVIGGIARRPKLIDGGLVEREMLAITIAVDHDIVDGAPAVRFADDFASMVEDVEALRAHLGLEADGTTR